MKANVMIANNTKYFCVVWMPKYFLIASYIIWPSLQKNIFKNLNARILFK